MAAAFQRTLAAASGRRSIKSIDIAGMLDKLADANKTIMFYEGARLHTAFNEHGSRLDHLADLVREGLQISSAQIRGGATVHRGSAGKQS